MTARVFVVTGSNKGVGFAAVKALCQKVGGNDLVYLTARSVERGAEAVKQLESDGLKPRFHQLDIEDQASIDAFAQYLKKEHGGLDVLVNNAAIAYKAAATEPFGEQAENTIRVNYFATQALCKALFPLLRSHARVMNVCSCVGHLPKVPGEQLRNKLSSDTTTAGDIDALMREFVTAAKNGSHTDLGWQNSAYGVSKVGLSALSRVQQKELDADTTREDMILNHCHPGYVDTDMTSHKGIFSPEKGCVALVFGAMIPKGAAGPRGQFIWHDTSVVDWVQGPLPHPGY